MTRFRALHLIFPALLFCLFTGALGWAQITSGSFRGTVTDSSGGVIAGAKVKMTETTLQVSRDATTDKTGQYLFPSVDLGTYDFTVSYSGFQTIVNSGVILQVGQNATLDFTLRPGSSVQEVTVTGQAPLLNTANATVGTVVDSEKVSQLPLNGRQFTQLMLLTPGASPQSTGQQNGYEVAPAMGAVCPAVNGARSEMNNFTMDGVENNELYFNFVALNPPPDAIQEFKVESDMSSGAFGRAAGANVNIVTKSGSDRLHFSTWDFLRNRSLNSRNFFNTSTSAFIQNQYGVTAGGPVIKHKLYAFGWWEGNRRLVGASNVALVPTAAQLNGDFSGMTQIFNPYTTQAAGIDEGGNPLFTRTAFDSNQIPSTMINKTAAALAALMYPSPNLPAGGAFNYINTQNETLNSDQFSIRMDTTLPKSTNFFGRYSYSDATHSTPSQLPKYVTDLTNKFQQAMFGLSRSMSTTSVLDFHAQFLRTGILYWNPPPAPTSFLADNNLLSQFPPAEGTPPAMPGMGISGFAGWGTQTWGPITPINNWEYNGSYTKILGRHTLAVGGSLIRTFMYENWNYGSAGFDQLPTSDPQDSANTGLGLASFLLGIPSNAMQFAGSDEFQLKGNYYGAYLNDEWRVTPKLTVTVGVRYDYASPMKELKGRLGGLDWEGSTPDKISWLTTVRNPITGAAPTAPNGVFYPNRKDWAPRAAIAYRLKKDLVLRSGYGMFYDFNQSNLQDQQETVGSWPFGVVDSVSGLNLPSPTALAPDRILGNSETPIFPPFTMPTTPPTSPGFAVERRNHTPYVQAWNVGIDKSVGNNWLIGVTYLGSKGTHIPIEFGVNTADTPGPGPLATRQRLPELSPVTIDGNWMNSSYNAAQVKLERRTAAGLAFLTSYTYSKTLDLASTIHGSVQPWNGIQDAHHFGASRGPADFDLTQNFVTSLVYDLPFGPGKRVLKSAKGAPRLLVGGWQASAIVSLNNGFPFSLAVPWDNANVGGNPQRPTQVSPLKPSGFNQTLNEWFDTNAVTVIPYTFGTLGRNVLRQDAYKNLDFSLMKRTRLTESLTLDFRAECFNILNHPNFAAPDPYYGDQTFGVVGSILGAPRELQFALKLNY